VRIEAVGIRAIRLVPGGRAHQQQQPHAPRQPHSPQLRFLARQPHDALRGGLVAQRLLDEARYQRGLFAQERHQFRLQPQPQGDVAHQVQRRFQAADEQEEHEAQQLRVRQRLAVHPRLDQVAHQIVSGVTPPLRQHPLEVASGLVHRGAHGFLPRGVVRADAGELGQVLCPADEERMHLGRQPQQLAQHAHGHGHGEGLHEVHFAVLGQVRGDMRGDLPHARFDAGEHRGAEGPVDEPPQPGVSRWIHDECRVRQRVVGDPCRAVGLAEALGREELGVFEHVHHVLVPGHGPDAAWVHLAHGGVLAQSGVERVGVGADLGCQQVDSLTHGGSPGEEGGSPW